MDWQLPDIGKMITNNILPSNLSEYAVRIGRYSHSVDRGSWLFPYCFELFPWIRIGLYIVVVIEIIKTIIAKIRFNSMNHMGHVLKEYFNRPNP